MSSLESTSSTKISNTNNNENNAAPASTVDDESAAATASSSTIKKTTTIINNNMDFISSSSSSNDCVDLKSYNDFVCDIIRNQIDDEIKLKQDMNKFNARILTYIYSQFDRGHVIHA